MDPQHIELDLGAEVPRAPIILESDDGTKQTLNSSKRTYTAAEILQQGSPGPDRDAHPRSDDRKGRRPVRRSRPGGCLGRGCRPT
jgi:hypothetical protein